MASSRNTSVISPGRTRRLRGKSALARPLAPEEICPQAYVAVLYEVAEFPACFFCDDASLTARDEMIRWRFTPKCGGVPMRVLRVCLPFVHVKLPDGRRQSIDVRRCQLAELGRSYARAAWKAAKKPTAAREAATK